MCNPTYLSLQMSIGNKLFRLYFTLADKKNEDTEYQLKCLHDAYQVATESKDESLQKAKCGLKLAKKYEENYDSKTALHVVIRFFNLNLFAI